MIKHYSIALLCLILCAACSTNEEPEEPKNYTLALLAEHNFGLDKDVFFNQYGTDLIARLPIEVENFEWVVSINFGSDQVYVDDSIVINGKRALDFTEEKTFNVVYSETNSVDYTVRVFRDTGLPVLYLELEDDDLPVTRDDYIKGDITVFGGSEETFITEKVKIRGRGNTTWEVDKKPFQIKFDEKRPVLGMPEDRRWILLANYYDKTMLRNFASFQWGEMSRFEWTPKGEFVDVVINNKYQGLYYLTQKVEQTNNRVDISPDDYLLEVDRLSRLDDDDVYFETDTFLFNIKEPNVIFGSEEYAYISDFVNEAENVLRFGDYKDPVNGYQKYWELESLIDWYLINEISKNNDSKFVTSVYMYLRRGEKLKMGPIWDFDIAYGNIDYNNNWETDGLWVKYSVWIKKMFFDEYFANRVKERYNYYYDNRQKIYDAIRSEAQRISQSQQLNNDKWDLIGNPTWPNYYVFDTYDQEVEHLISWIDERMEWMKANWE